MDDFKVRIKQKGFTPSRIVVKQSNIVVSKTKLRVPVSANPIDYVITNADGKVVKMADIKSSYDKREVNTTTIMKSPSYGIDMRKDMSKASKQTAKQYRNSNYSDFA